MIEDSILTLTPENESIFVNEFHAGRAVKVIESYDNWSYIEAYVIWDSNNIISGWVNSSALGYYEDLKSNVGIEVLIKDGFEPEWAQGCDELWGMVFDETDDIYTLLTPGASSVDVKKENVEPFITLN